MQGSDVTSLFSSEWDAPSDEDHSGPEDLFKPIEGGQSDILEEAGQSEVLDGGVSGLRFGDDFRTDQPQKMYVVGRSRMKLFTENRRGNFNANGIAPLDPVVVQETFRGKTIEDADEFMTLWISGISQAYLTELDFQGNDHNKIQGPGRFAWDIRLMKYMELRKKPGDINHNTTYQEAMRKLRSLHATIFKLFGSSWTRWTSAPADTIEKQNEALASLDAEPFRDPFELFTADDLMVNPEWTLPQAPVNNVRSFSKDGEPQGAVYIVSKQAQTEGQLDAFEGALDETLGNPIPFMGGSTQTTTVASQVPVASQVHVASVSPSMPSASHWLSAGLSKQDTVSRIGSLSRASRIEKQYLENEPEVEVQRTSQGQIQVVPTGHPDLEELDLQNVNWPPNASIVSMILGSPVESLRKWQDTSVMQAKSPIILVPTAWDTLGSYSKRMTLSEMDRLRAMPDLEILAMISDIFDVRPASAHVWSPTVPLWSTRHVKSLEARHEMAYELAAARASNVFHTSSTSIYAIPFVVLRKRAF